MNLNSINYESVTDKHDPGFFSQYESVSENDENDSNVDDLTKQMLLYVYEALDNFDKSNENSKLNPYEDQLTMETSTGDLLIPVELQQLAITQWQNMKKNATALAENENNTNSVDIVGSLFHFLLCILIIFTLMYTLSLFRRGVIRF
jgi:hypothetical protein